MPSHGQPADPAGASNPQENPTPTGPAVPSDVKQPPLPHKPFDFTVYGRVNVSFDVGNQELTTAPCITAAAGPCAPPAGNLRWLPDLSSNLSRLGVRGYHDLGGADYQAVFQLETQVDVTATPGSKPNGSNDTINPANTAVTGALASRNSFVGIKTPLGALKLGKNDTPYKSVTADFDFLADTPGDYNSIMGNTGGDNRTEFDARMPHAVWYESPDLLGFRLNAIWSPGQNRFEDNIGYAIGENACAGGNAGPCNDGSFGDAYGASAEWQGSGLKLIAAYEMHRKTNRTGDAGQDTAAGTSVVGHRRRIRVEVRRQVHLGVHRHHGGRHFRADAPQRRGRVQRAAARRLLPLRAAAARLLRRGDGRMGARRQHSRRPRRGPRRQYRRHARGGAAALVQPRDGDHRQLRAHEEQRGGPFRHRPGRPRRHLGLQGRRRPLDRQRG